MQAESKKDVLRVRISERDSKLIDQACAISHAVKSDFVRQLAVRRSQEIIDEYNKTVFNESDWLNFFEAMESPPTPTDSMKKAAECYKRITEV